MRCRPPSRHVDMRADAAARRHSDVVVGILFASEDRRQRDVTLRVVKKHAERRGRSYVSENVGHDICRHT